jgi:hypothetical protein
MPFEGGTVPSTGAHSTPAHGIIEGFAPQAGPLIAFLWRRPAPSLEGPVMLQTRTVLGNTTAVAAFGDHTGLAKVEGQHMLSIVRP